MGGEVGPAVAQGAALPREDELRPDGVGGRREQSRVVERDEDPRRRRSRSRPWTRRRGAAARRRRRPCRWRRRPRRTSARSRGESILSAVILGHGGAHEDLSLLTSWTFDPLAVVAIALAGVPLLPPRADARASRIARRRLAPLVVRGRPGARRLRALLAARRVGRAGVLLRAHGAARAARGARAAGDRRRADGPAASSAARLQVDSPAARARPPARGLAAVGGEPLPLAPAVLLRGGARERRRPRARARRVLHCGRALLGPGARAAARPSVVRHGHEAPLHRRRPLHEHGARERARVGRRARSTTSTSTPSPASASLLAPTRASPAR